MEFSATPIRGLVGSRLPFFCIPENFQKSGGGGGGGPYSPGADILKSIFLILSSHTYIYMCICLHYECTKCSINIILLYYSNQICLVNL